MAENGTNGHVKETVVEDGTEFEGALRSKCPVAVSGRLKGEVSAPALTVTRISCLFLTNRVDTERHGPAPHEISARTAQR